MGTSRVEVYPVSRFTIAVLVSFLPLTNLSEFYVQMSFGLTNHFLRYIGFLAGRLREININYIVYDFKK